MTCYIGNMCSLLSMTFLYITPVISTVGVFKVSELRLNIRLMFPSFSNCILWLDKLAPSLVRARYYCEKSNINLDTWQIEIFKKLRCQGLRSIRPQLLGVMLYTSTPSWNNSFRVLYIPTIRPPLQI